MSVVLLERGGRHVGRVEAIHRSALVRVRWRNGWITDLPLDDVECAPSARRQV
jgi:hypothetical protein